MWGWTRRSPPSSTCLRGHPMPARTIRHWRRAIRRPRPQPALSSTTIGDSCQRAGLPGNGKPFPDGAKMAKIHWNPKKNQYFPDTTVPGTLHDVDFMVKDSNRFAEWRPLNAHTSEKKSEPQRAFIM